MSIRVLLADDHTIVRKGLTALLEDLDGMEVVGEAGDGREALELARELAPDIVLMDVTMPNLNGVEATRQIAEAVPGAKVIALSIHSDRQFIQEMLRAGAAAYVRKGSSVRELSAAIRSVVQGHTYLCPEATDVVTEDYVRQLPSGQGRPYSVLTAREREVLQLLAEGMSGKSIAASLNISVKTVSTHRRNIMRKLGLNNVADLVKYAVREGLTSLES
ncbi:MAG: response regulator [Planctomycetota bacterium]|jgi:DNA-binding NarL/FixJ family response regulator